MIISTVSGFIGILDLIRLGSMDPGDYGLNIVLPPIVAAVIGGTALTGGRATVLGTLIGALFLGILEDGLNLTGVSANWFFLLEGDHHPLRHGPQWPIEPVSDEVPMMSTAPEGPGAAPAEGPADAAATAGGRTISDEVILRVEGISKHFGAVVALEGVDLNCTGARCSGLVGDNGAGKSTLVKSCAGSSGRTRAASW